MRIGTKSVLYGAHCFLLHPWFVAAAWTKLFGFPWDPRLWFAFALHDIGYLGLDGMDTPEGERHVELGARIMSWLFDRERPFRLPGGRGRIGKWGQLCLLHSRFYAKHYGLQPSRLCIADKLAIALTPSWLYLPMVRATGEIREYRQNAEGIDSKINTSYAADLRWYTSLQKYMRQWVDEHRDGRPDTWTKQHRDTLDAAGVWR